MTTAFTIVAKNYLAFARTLMNSIAQTHPEWQRVIIVVDEVEGCFDPDQEKSEVLLLSDLPIPRLAFLRFQYDVMELSTAVKPFVFRHLFETRHPDKVFYFDPDILILGRLPELVDGLDEGFAVITPHCSDPLPPDGKVPHELEFLRSGAYNLGFIGLRYSGVASNFLHWWEARLVNGAYSDLSRGLFTDQKWIDLMPCFFPGVRIERSTRFNVAYWNLASRIVEFENGKWTVDGQPLGFFHFSGLNPESPKAFSKHQNRFTLDGIGEAKELVLMYAQSVLEQGHRDSKKWKYTYNYFAGGQEIPLRTLPSTEDLFEGIADPFSDIGRDRFFSYWNGPATGFAGETADGVTRHAFLIYNMRPDVRAAMPMIFSLDRTQFLNWMITSGQREHRLKEGTLGPIRAALERCCQEQADGPGRAPEKDPKGGRQSEPRPPSGGQFVPHALKKLASHVPPAVLALLLNNSVELEDAIEALDAEGTLHQWLLETPVSEPLLPRLSCLIYDSRPDLQYKFPRFRAGDIRTFGLWLAIHGKAEYALPDSLVTDMMRKMTVPLALRGGIGSFVLRAILLLNPPPKQSAKTA